MNLLHTLQSVFLFYALTVVAHILICRFDGGKHFMLKGVLLGLLAGSGLLVYQVAVERIDLVGLYLFVAAWLLYLMIFINLLNSVTLKMLAHLHGKQNGRLTVEEFSTAFNINDGLVTRLEMMKENGLLERRGAIFKLTGKSRTLLKIITVVNRLFSLKRN
jgi:hypothetical protein